MTVEVVAIKGQLVDPTVTDVREPGVLGLFARPAGPGPFPGVVVFGGQKRQNIEAARRARMRSRSRLRVYQGPRKLNSRRTEAITNEMSC